MNEQVARNYNESADIFGFPQVFRGIEFYPIKMKDLEIAEIFYALITYPKNSIQDKDILKMSYLNFIISVPQDKKKIKDQIEKLFQCITMREDVSFGLFKIEEGNEERWYRQYWLKIGDIEIDEWSFEDLREILLEQNGRSIEWVNQYHPELEEKILKIQDINSIPFRDQIFTLVALSGMSPLEIGEFTISQFQDIFEKSIMLEQFRTQMLFAAQGALKSADIKNYLYKKGKKHRYSDILIGSDEYFEDKKDAFARSS